MTYRCIKPECPPSCDMCNHAVPVAYTHCIECKQPFSPENVFTRDGAKETQISGICEACFDELFEGMEEEEIDFEDEAPF